MMQTDMMSSLSWRVRTGESSEAVKPALYLVAPLVSRFVPLSGGHGAFSLAARREVNPSAVANAQVLLPSKNLFKIFHVPDN